MHADEEQRSGRDDEEMPRRSFWASLPKRSFSRVVLLLALLAVILYLQRRTGTIAGCVSDAFQVAPPAQPRTVRLKTTTAPAAQPRDGAYR